MTPTEQLQPHAEQIAESSSNGVGIGAELLIPLILDVLPRVLTCLANNEQSPQAAAAESRLDSNRMNRLGNRYWRRSRRIGPAITIDQAMVLARNTVDVAHTQSAETLYGLTAAALAMPLDDDHDRDADE